MGCFDDPIFIPDVQCEDCEMTKDSILEALGLSEMEADLTLSDGAVIERIILGRTA